MKQTTPADGIITLAITVTSAVEGLLILDLQLPVVTVVLVIISFPFMVQQFGTNFLGRSFGPMMLFWFSMLAVLGFSQIIQYPAVLKAVNPFYAIIASQAPISGGYTIISR